MTNPVLSYYETRFAAHGDSAQGAGWPNEADRITRFDVVLDMARTIAGTDDFTLCDIGCGTGELSRHMRARGLDRIGYLGADGLDGPLAEARRKFPGVDFRKLDIASGTPAEFATLACDVAVANGVFTVKAGMSQEAMWDFMTYAIGNLWPVVRRGIVFNVMSPVVDWEREDLFHLSHDRLAVFLHGLAGRAIGFRADYGLYEYMAYAIKRPR